MNENPYKSTATFDGISYIERDADRNLVKEINKNQSYPYCLAPRQSGKSSLIAHTIKKLDSNNFETIFIDFSEFSPEELNSYYNFLDTLTDKIKADLSLFDTIERAEDFTATKNLKSTLEYIAKNEKRVIIFLDEIDRIIDLDFKDAFFGLIRSFFNERTNNRKTNFYQIQFILSGAANPTELISKANVSPFNLGTPISFLAGV